MSVLRSFEDKLSGLVEGTFGRVFKSEVRPVELARKLAKEMDSHRTISVSRTYVPNEYIVWLSPRDRERYDGIEREVVEELTAYLLEHVRRERLVLNGVPRIEFRTEDTFSLGEFGIQARMIRVSEDDQVRQADHSQTAIYSAPEPRAPAAKAVLIAEGKRTAIGADGAVIGRSRDCDVVLADSNVSRRHARIAASAGGWTIEDLGSTNGVRVNGRAVRAPHPLQGGDEIEFGTAHARFEAA